MEAKTLAIERRSGESLAKGCEYRKTLGRKITKST
jgi:hypothetical protein